MKRLRDLLKGLSVDFIEPTNLFEQLEERVVLDASITPVADQNVNQNDQMTVDVQAADEGTAPSLTYTLEVNSGSGYVEVADGDQINTDGATVSFDSSTGVITWTPNNSDVGSYSFLVTCNDGDYGTGSHTETETFSVTVQNTDPTFYTAASASFIEDGDDNTFNIDTDDEGHGATYSLSSDAPSWLSIDTLSGELSTTITLTNEQVGSYQFTINVYDGHTYAYQTFTLDVANTIDFTSAANTSVNEDGSLTFDVQTDSETSGVDVTYSLTGSDVPSWLSIDPTTGEITGDPDNSMVGTYTFTVHAASAEGDLDQIFTLTVENTIDFTSASTYSINEDQHLNFDVQTDSEVNGVDVTYSLTGSDVPSWLSIDPTTGEITGDPDNSMVGTYTFTVHATSAEGDLDQTFTLTVDNVDPIITTDHELTVTEDSGFHTFDVDSTDEGQGSTYTLVGAPDGVVIDATTGVISFDPTNELSGTHTFTIQVFDGTSTVEQLFTLTVNNVAPVITSGNSTTFSEDGGEQTFNVASTDENQGSTYTLIGAPDGVVIDATTGVISWDPDDSDVGVHNFTISVNDGTTTVTQEFTLTVTNEIDFTSADNYTQVEDEQVLFDVQTDSETDGVQVTYSLEGAPSWLEIDSVTGVISGNPDNSMVGVYTFTVHAVSAEGDLDETFTLTVTNTASALLNEETDIYMTENSGVQTFDVQTSDEDVPTDIEGYSLASYDGGAVPSWLTIDPITGIISGNPFNEDVGTHTLVVQFDDGNAENGVQTYTFTLHVAHIANQFESANATTWVEDATPTAFNVQTLHENEAGSNVTYSFEGGALTWQLTSTLSIKIDPDTGVITLNEGTLDNSTVGEYTFTIYADENVPSDTTNQYVTSQEFTLTILNTVPIITSDNLVNVYEDAPETIFQVETDFDEPGATYSFTYATDIDGFTVDISTDGLITITQTSNGDVGGVYLFNITVNDGNGGISTQFFTVNVLNTAPVFTSLPDADASGTITIAVDEDDTYSFDINTDDEGDGDTAYTTINGIAGVSIDSETGVLTVSPDNSVVGTHTITVQFSDGNGGIATQDIVIEVANVDPQITSASTTTWVEDAGYYSFTFTSDDDGQGTVTYTLSGEPSWLTWNGTTHTISYVPENAEVGTWTFFVTVDDGNGGTDMQEFTLVVTNTEPAFVTENDVYFQTGVVNQTFDVHTTDENSDRDSTSGYPNGNEYRLSGTDASYFSIDEKTGVITYDGSAPADDYTFTIEFFDGTSWITQEFTVHITDTPPDDADHTDGFYSTNNTTFLEDEANQTFDVQFEGESTGNYTYSLRTITGGDAIPDGLVINSNTGVITWSPTNDDVTDGTGYVFEIVVTDKTTGTEYTQDFTLEVQNVTPWFETPALSIVFTEDATPGTYNVDNTDENDGTEATYSLVNGADNVPDWLKIDSVTGHIYSTQTFDNDDEMGTWHVQVMFDDGHGGVIYQDLTVTVANTLNFTSASTTTWQEDNSTGTFSFDVNTDDDSSAHGVTYSLGSDAPAWLQIDENTGVITFIDGFTPDNTDPGTYTFTIHADDGNGGGSQTFTLIISNRDPVFDQTEYTITEDGGEQIVDLHADDEGQGGTYYTWSPTSDMQWLTLDPQTGQITGTPTNDEVGTYTFTVYCYDLNANHAYGTDNDGYTMETITIVVQNRVPQWESADNTTVQEDSALTFNVQTDDEGDGDTYYYLGSDAPDWVSIDAETGILTGNPTNSEVGTYTFTIYCDDGNGGVAEQTFTLAVTNKVPEWQNPPSGTYTVTLTEDTSGNYYDLLTDDEGQDVSATNRVTYSLSDDAPPGVSIDPYTGILTITPTNSDVGTHTFNIYCDDGNGGIAVLSFTLTVKNTDPVFTSDNAVTWWEDDSLWEAFDVGTTDEPYERFTGDNIEYTLIGAPDWLEIDSLTGELSIVSTSTQNINGSPDNSMVGVYTFTIDFYDGSVHKTQAFTLTINNTATVIDEVADQTLYEDTPLVLDDDTVTASDEYDITGYDDYYVLYIDWHDEVSQAAPGEDYVSGWITVEEYNAMNDAWDTSGTGTANDITFDPKTGELTWTPNNGDVGTHEFIIVHYDANGSWDKTEFTVTVNNVDPVWVVDPLPDWNLVEDDTLANSTYDADFVQADEEGQGDGFYYVLQVSLETDASGNAINWVTYTATYQPNGEEGGWLTFDSETGQITWQTTNADVTYYEDSSGNLVNQPYTFRVIAYDGNGGETEWSEFSVSVSNDPTDITDIPDQTVDEDSTLTIDVGSRDEANSETDPDNSWWQDSYYELIVDGNSVFLSAYDPDQSIYTYTLTSGSVITFNKDTGVIEWTPNDLDVGDHSFTVTQYDGHGSSATDSFTVTVNDVSPTFETITVPNGHLTEDDYVNYTDTGLWTIDIDTDDESEGGVTYTLYINGYEVEVDAVTHIGTYQPNGSEGGTITFYETSGVIEWTTTNADVTTHSDGTSISGLDPYTVTVVAVDNDDPTLTTETTFSVKVYNASDSITDQGNITLTEDTSVDTGGSGYWLDMNSADEQVESTDSDYYENTYYTVTVAHDGTTYTFTQDGTSQWYYCTPNAADTGAGLEAGGTIWYNADTGEMHWGSSDRVNGDWDSGVNNRDVGTYTFTVTHNDGHGSTVTDTFTVTVEDTDPSLEVPTETVVLVEDDATASTIADSAIDSEDEGLGLTYSLYINGELWTNYADQRPNGEEGGQIVFDTQTGEITWLTTNADVTNAADGSALGGLSAYTFEIIADDGNGGTTSKIFHVEVWNADPDITIIPTDSNGDNVWVIDEDGGSANYFDIGGGDGQHNVNGNDEQSETSNSSITWADAYYELKVGGESVVDAYYDESTSTYTYVVNTDGGTITFNKDTGEITFDANNRDVGTYTFEVTHYDGHGGEDTETFTVTVVDTAPSLDVPDTWVFVEDPTSSDPDSYSIIPDSAIDSEDEGLGLTYTLYIDGVLWTDYVDGKVNGSDGGVLTFNTETGEITWITTNADVTNGENGEDLGIDPYEFTIVADDGNGQTTTETITVEVWNRDPDITSVPTDGASGDEWIITEDAGTANSFDLASNDEESESTDSDRTTDAYYELQIEGHSVVDAFYDESASIYTYVINAADPANGLESGGTVTFNKDTGEITFTANNRDVGSYEFTVIHYDGHGGEDTETFTVTVVDTDPSLEVPTETVVLVEDDATASTIADSAIDSEDEGLGLTYSLYINGELWTNYADQRPNGEEGGQIVFDTQTGEITWLTTNADVTNAADGSALDGLSAYTFEIIADDGNGGTSSKTFSVEVWNADPDITIIPTDSNGDNVWVIDEDGGSANYFDIGGGDDQHNVNGNDEQSETSNPSPEWADAYYELKVDGISVVDAYYDESTSIYTYVINAADPANGLESGGTVTFNKDTGEITFTANNRDVGTYEFTVTHYDGHGGEDTETFTVTVANEDPTLDVPETWTFHEDATEYNTTDSSLYSIDASLIGSNDEGQGATYTLYVEVNGTLVEIDPSGTQINEDGGYITYDAQTGEIVWHTTNADVTLNSDGSRARDAYEFTVQVDDGNGGVTEKVITVEVTNEDPVVTQIGDQTIYEDGAALQLSNSDVVSNDELVGDGTYYTLEIHRDGQAGSVDVTYYNENNSDGADIVFDASTGAIYWSTTNRDVGTYEFTVTHYDGHAGTDSTTFQVTVVNEDPVITSSPGYDYGATVVVPATLEFSYDVNSTDEGQHDWRGDDTVTYSLVQGLGNMTIDPYTGTISWIAQPELAGGPYLITIRVEDGNGGWAEQSFYIIVDDYKGDLPIEVRPEQAPFEPYHEAEGGMDKPGSQPEQGNIFGTILPGTQLPDQIPLPLPSGKIIEEILRAGTRGVEDLFADMGWHDLKQPSLDKLGSISPITALDGFTEEVAHGKRLDFSAEDVLLWSDLSQPKLPVGGSTSPETPLEGYEEAVEVGKRLNFEYFPIHETISLKIDDMRVGDLLKI